MRNAILGGREGNPARGLFGLHREAIHVVPKFCLFGVPHGVLQILPRVELSFTSLAFVDSRACVAGATG